VTVALLDRVLFVLLMDRTLVALTDLPSKGVPLKP